MGKDFFFIADGFPSFDYLENSIAQKTFLNGYNHPIAGATVKTQELVPEQSRFFCRIHCLVK